MKLEKNNALLELNKQLIPGGKVFGKVNLFEQGSTPFSFCRGKGARLWDVDGNEYVDFIQSLGSIILGYCYEPMDKAIREQLKNGISFSLSTPWELEVARKLVEMVPCAEMVRFGKNGSDVLAAAVKLSRYITGRDHVATTGFHGMADWSLAQTSRFSGIPESIRKLSHKIVYNNIDSLHRLIHELDGDLSCVVMDVVARNYPEPGYLEEVRELTAKHGILLIFDEVITGFRMHKGGAQAFFKVTPDLACFGKALANGAPISALVGKAEYMRRSEELFYSLTFAGETLSLAAAKAVLDIYDTQEIAKDLHEKGMVLKDGLQNLLDQHDLNDIFKIQGMPCRPILGFQNPEHHPFLQQEDKLNDLMLLMIRGFAEEGILYNSSIFISHAHTHADLNFFLDHFNLLCPLIKNEIR